MFDSLQRIYFIRWCIRHYIKRHNILFCLIPKIYCATYFSVSSNVSAYIWIVLTWKTVLNLNGHEYNYVAWWNAGHLPFVFSLHVYNTCHLHIGTKWHFYVVVCLENNNCKLHNISSDSTTVHMLQIEVWLLHPLRTAHIACHILLTLSLIIRKLLCF
jgi:hypothetical protein